jgi:hypothetical protein
MPSETINVHRMTEEPKAIREDLDYIKGHMVDVDTILTPKEEEKLNEAIEEHKSGKVISLEDFEKELGQ